MNELYRLIEKWEGIAFRNIEGKLSKPYRELLQDLRSLQEEECNYYKLQLAKDFPDNIRKYGIWIEISKALWKLWEKSEEGKKWDLAESMECQMDYEGEYHEDYKNRLRNMLTKHLGENTSK